MDFTIYSIGETAFMYEVLMGLRRMFDFGFSSLHILIGATALLSLMTLVVKSWINPNSNPVLSWFIGLCMFMVLCGPFSKVDVVIESVRTGDVYYVNDAPGIAAVIAMMTSGMYGLSRDYEDSFASPDGYQAGQFLDPMRALVALDKFGYMGSEELDSVVDDQRYRIKTSTMNYLQDCVIWDLQVGGNDAELNADKIKNAPMENFLESIRINTPSRSSYIQIDTPAMELLTCPNAYLKLKSYFDSSSFREMTDRFLQKENVKPQDVEAGAESISALSATMNAYHLATGRYLSNVFAEAAAKSGDMQGLRSELTLIETKSQRHYQMAADRNLALELSIGFATFIEAFVFFLIPVIAIMLVMGAEAMKSAAMFFGVTVWVNLWPVTMSAVNLFTLLAIQGRFTSVSAGGGGVSAITFGMWGHSMSTIESFIAVASSLAAAVPMLTLYILHRGVHTMMGVSNKTSPDTNIDSKKLSPDVTTSANGGKASQGDTTMQASDVHSSYGQWSQAQLNGGQRNDVSINPGGAGPASGYLKQSSTELSAIGSRNTQLANTEAASQTLQKTATDSKSATLDSIKGYKHGESFESVDTSQLSEDEAFLAAQTAAYATENNMSLSDAYDHVLQGTASMIAKASTPTMGGGGFGTNKGSGSSNKPKGAGGLGLGMDAKAAISAKAASQKQVGNSEKLSEDDRAQVSESIKANWGNAVKMAQSSSSDNSIASKEAVSRQKAVTNAHTNMLQAQALEAEGNTASSASKVMAQMNAGEVQNSTSGANKSSLGSIVSALSEEQQHALLGSLIGDEDLKNLSGDKNSALISELGDRFDYHKEQLNKGDNARLPESQKNNIALANTVTDAIARMSGNTEVLSTDHNGNQLPLSTGVTALKQANTERGASAGLMRELGETLQAPSLISLSDQLNGYKPSDNEHIPKPKDNTGIDINTLNSDVNSGIKDDPTSLFNNERNAKALAEHKEQSQNEVNSREESGSGAVKAKGEDVVSESENVNASNLGHSFGSLKLMGSEANKLTGGAISSIGELFTLSVGDAVSNELAKSGNGNRINSDLLDMGFGVLSNNTPQAIRELLNSAASGGSSMINGEYLSPNETLMYAGAIQTAMRPESIAAFNESLNSNAAQLAKTAPNNPFKNAKENISEVKAMQSNESINEALKNSELIATYAALTNLSDGDIKDVISATQGENSMFGMKDTQYMKHLEALNELSDYLGVGTKYDSTQYQSEDSNNSKSYGGRDFDRRVLEHPILNNTGNNYQGNRVEGESKNIPSSIVRAITSGDFDSDAKKIADYALNQYRETGDKNGASFKDINDSNYQEYKPTSQFTRELNPIDTTNVTPEAMSDLHMMKNALEVAGRSDEAEVLTNTISSINYDEQTRNGYNSSTTKEYENQIVNNALRADGISPRAKEFAANALFGTGGLPGKVEPSDMGDLLKINNLLSNAPEAQQILSQAITSAFNPEYSDAGTKEANPPVNSLNSSEASVPQQSVNESDSEKNSVTQQNSLNETPKDSSVDNNRGEAIEEPPIKPSEVNSGVNSTGKDESGNVLSKETLVAGNDSRDRIDTYQYSGTKDDSYPNTTDSGRSLVGTQSENLQASVNTGGAINSGSGSSDRAASPELQSSPASTYQSANLQASVNTGGAINSEGGSSDRAASPELQSSPVSPDQSENLQASASTGSTLNSEGGSSDRAASPELQSSPVSPDQSENLQASANGGSIVAEPSLKPDTSGDNLQTQSQLIASNSSQKGESFEQSNSDESSVVNNSSSENLSFNETNASEAEMVNNRENSIEERNPSGLQPVAGDEVTRTESQEVGLRQFLDKTEMSNDALLKAESILSLGSNSNLSSFTEEEKAELLDLADNLEANNYIAESLQIKRTLES